MKYNYIFFNMPDNMHKKQTEGFWGISTRDLETNNHVQMVAFPSDSQPIGVRLLYRVLTSGKVNRLIPLPLRELAYPLLVSSSFPKDEPLCFIVLGWYCSVAYVRYLRQAYPKARIVKLHTNLVEAWRRDWPEFTEDVCSELFDLRFTYDEGDAAKFNLIPFSLYGSKIDVPMDKDYPLSDVYFAGEVKGRLPRLMEAYRIFTDAGLRCSYCLVGVPKKERIPLPGIKYVEHGIQYREILYNTVNSRCVLEINQGGAISYTARFCEAVMYGKKLITDNVTIKGTKFYDPRFMQCVESVRHIRPEFVVTDVGKVDYHYDNEFSPIHLIERIDDELIKLDVQEGRA